MLRIAFFGTPQFSIPFLQALIHDPFFDICAVIAQPDTSIGRKKHLISPPTIDLAKKNQLPILQPKHIKKNEQFSVSLQNMQADLFVVVAYGKILPKEILSLPKFGIINVHPSALPAYRGPSPMQTALRNGDIQTAVTIMKMDQEMDHGPILASQEVVINEHDLLSNLEQRVHEIGVPLLLDTIKKYTAKEILPIEQDHTQATYCNILERKDGYITQSHTIMDIWNMWRAYYPWPGLTCKTESSAVYKIHGLLPPSQFHKKDIHTIWNEQDRLFLSTQTGSVEITHIQAQGRTKITASEFIRGLEKQQIHETLMEM